jgi:hypothetical protein
LRLATLPGWRRALLPALLAGSTGCVEHAPAEPADPSVRLTIAMSLQAPAPAIAQVDVNRVSVTVRRTGGGETVVDTTVDVAIGQRQITLEFELGVSVPDERFDDSSFAFFARTAI